MKCTHERCAQKPELKQTGWHSPHPVYYCPVCKRGYFEHTEEVKDAKNKVVFIKVWYRDHTQSEKWGMKSAQHYFENYDYDWLKK